MVAERSNRFTSSKKIESKLLEKIAEILFFKEDLSHYPQFSKYATIPIEIVELPLPRNFVVARLPESFYNKLNELVFQYNLSKQFPKLASHALKYHFKKNFFLVSVAGYGKISPVRSTIHVKLGSLKLIKETSSLPFGEGDVIVALRLEGEELANKIQKIEKYSNAGRFNYFVPTKQFSIDLLPVSSYGWKKYAFTDFILAKTTQKRNFEKTGARPQVVMVRAPAGAGDATGVAAPGGAVILPEESGPGFIDIIKQLLPFAAYFFGIPVPYMGGAPLYDTVLARKIFMELMRISPGLLAVDANEVGRVVARTFRTVGMEINVDKVSQFADNFLRSGGLLVLPFLGELYSYMVGVTPFTITNASVQIVATLLSRARPDLPPEELAKRGVLLTTRVSENLYRFFKQNPALGSLYPPQSLASFLGEMLTAYPHYFHLGNDDFSSPEKIEAAAKRISSRALDFLPLLAAAKHHGLDPNTLKKFIIENNLDRVNPKTVALALLEQLGHFSLGSPQLTAVIASQSPWLSAAIRIKKAVEANPDALMHPMVDSVYASIKDIEAAVAEGKMPNVLSLSRLQMAGLVLGIPVHQITAPVSKSDIVKNMKLIGGAIRMATVDVFHAAGVPPPIAAAILSQLQSEDFKNEIIGAETGEEVIRKAALRAGLPPPMAESITSSVARAAQINKVPLDLITEPFLRTVTPVNPDAVLVKLMYSPSHAAGLEGVLKRLRSEEPAGLMDLLMAFAGYTEPVRSTERLVGGVSAAGETFRRGGNFDTMWKEMKRRSGLEAPGLPADRNINRDFDIDRIIPPSRLPSIP